jgi:hypothetical protein
VLRRNRKSRREPCENQPPRRRRFHITIKRVNGGEQKTGETGIGSHDRAVRQEVRVKYQQSKSDESGASAEHFLRCKEHQHCEQHREERHGQASAKQHSVCIVVEEKFLAAKKAFEFEEGILQRRHFYWQMQKRQRGDQLHQWQVLGIQAEIAMLPGHIAGVDVVVFIPRERIAMNGKRELQPENSNQKNNAGDHPGAAARRSRFSQGSPIRERLLLNSSVTGAPVGAVRHSTRNASSCSTRTITRPCGGTVGPDLERSFNS